MTGREYRPEVATRWHCNRCHTGFTSPMPMPTPAHYCPRTYGVRPYSPAWSPERAVEAEDRPS